MTLPPELPGLTAICRLRTLYRALGDETRLRMIGLLAETGPVNVLELARRSTSRSRSSAGTCASCGWPG